MSGKPSIEDAFKAFRRVEERRDLMARRVGGVPYWHLIRFSLLHDHILPGISGLGEAHPDAKNGAGAKRKERGLDRLKARVAGHVARLSHSPFLTRGEKPVVFALRPRLTRLPDGGYRYLMLDFFLEKLGHDFAVLDYTSGEGDALYRPAYRTFWLPVSRLRRRVRRVGAGAEAETSVREEAAFIASAFRSDMEVGLEAERVFRCIVNALELSSCLIPYMRRMLRRWRTKCVVESVHYGIFNMLLTSAAHAEGIPVIELQHGEIHQAHTAYNLPVGNSVYTPDYFLSWSGFWLGNASNFPATASVHTGYPFFDYNLTRYPRTAGAPVTEILFISQGTIGAELSKVAVRLARGLPKGDYRIRYKLHPSETKSWKTIYPWLAETPEIEVVTNVDRNIYACLQTADVAVGVYSTAVVEASAWGVRSLSLTFLPGAEVMRPFVDNGYVEPVGDERTLTDLLLEHRSGRWKSDGRARELWLPDAARNVVRQIGKCVAEGRL